MSLVSCNECKRQISDQATSCPHCGCPTSSSKNRSFRSKRILVSVCIALALVAIGSIIALIAILSGNGDTNHDISENYSLYGRRAVEILDQYLDGDTTKRQTGYSLTILSGDIEEIPRTEDEKLLKQNVLAASSLFVSVLDTPPNQLDVMRIRNDIAQIVGEDQR